MSFQNIRNSMVVRIAAIHILIFIMVISLFGGYVYWRVSQQMWQQLEQHIASEIESLAETYQVRGQRGLLQVIDERLARVPDRRSVYLVEDSAGRWLIGNITKWPTAEEEPGDWLTFELFDKSTDSMTSARVRTFALSSGGRLLVGRDTGELNNTLVLIRRALGWGLAFACITAIIFTSLFAAGASAKLAAIQRVSKKVREGDLEVRVPESGGSSDLDELSRSMNMMLDEINGLMIGIERVSDNIAHDLRTPLARVRNRLSSFENQPDEVLRRGLKACVQEIDELIETFNALMRIARLDSKNTSLRQMQCNLDEVVTNSVELYSPVADSRAQDIIVSGEAGEIRGDTQLITQALCNVLDNAIKFSPVDSEIRIKLARDATAAKIEISDRGNGISAEDQDKVLQRFYRGERARQTKGSGLGLSLVKAVLDAHKAKLSLSENFPGLKVEMIFPHELLANS